jgi:hypothetical protein
LSGTWKVQVFRDASEVVWLPRGFEFLSGLPEIRRRRRPVVALQAYIDDSGGKGTGKLLLVGGLLASAEALASLTDQWERELRAELPHRIAYFKASEAQNMRDEFAHWSRKGRDEKVRRLARLLDRDDLVMVYGGVDLLAFRQNEAVFAEYRSKSKHHFLNEPYLMALLSALLTIGTEAHRFNQPVEIVVDDHSVFKAAAREHYAALLEKVPEWLRKRLPSELYFRDDRDFVVLQAADLLMGHLRMGVEKVSRWPELEFDKLKATPFGNYQWAKPLGEIAAREMERRSGLPKNFLRVTVHRPDDGAGS